MKKILTTYIVFILLVACGQDERWQTISPKGLEGKFNDMLFINDSTGWIVGSKMEMSLKNQDAVTANRVAPLEFSKTIFYNQTRRLTGAPLTPSR